MKIKSFVTLLLFLAAFSIASRKIQKGKVQRIFYFVWVCVLNLSSNSLEKTKQIKQIVCGGGCCLGKRAKLAIGVWGGENVRSFDIRRKQGKLLKKQ